MAASTNLQPELVVLPVEYPAPVPAHVSAAVDEAIRQGVRRSGVAERSAETSEPCADAACFAEVAEALQVGEMLQIRVEQRNDRVYGLYLALVDRTGRVLASRSTECELCGVTELSESVQNLAAAIATRFVELPRGPGTLVLESRPRGASIFVDGEPRGETPARLELSPGRHVVELRAPGFGAARRALDTVSGIEQELMLHLEAVGSTAPASSYRLGAEIAGWTLMAASPIAIGLGGWLIALDGDPYRPSCTPSMPESLDGRCPSRYESLAGGISLVVTGGVALATGIGLVVWQRRLRPRGTTARFEPRVGGLAVRF